MLAYLYGSVLKTTIYRMWYQAGGIYVAYARSRDGISWEKPLVKGFTVEEPSVGPTVASEDVVERCTSAGQPLQVKSNVVLDLHMPSMVYDPPDRVRRFKLFGFTDRLGTRWRLSAIPLAGRTHELAGRRPVRAQ